MWAIVSKALFSRLAGPIASGVAVLLLGLLAFVWISKGGEVRSLRDEIHNPKTGYLVQLQAARSDLMQCRSNGITLQQAIGRQNDALDDAKIQSARKAAQLESIASDYRNKLEAAQGQVRTILARKGASCADADALILENVK